MDYQHDYHEELKRQEKRDLGHNWVSSSAFLFYLQVFCIVAFLLGSCYMLYTKRYSRPDVKVQESTLYNPTYK